VIDLRLGDCLEVLPTLPAQSVDAIITDLPYGTTACKWDTVIPFAPMWAEVKRVLRSRGAFVTTASQPFTSALVCSNLAWFRYGWVWKKNRPTGFLDAKQRPLNDYEDIPMFSSGQTVYNPQMTQGKPNHVKDGRINDRKRAEQYSHYNKVSEYKTPWKYPRRVIEVAQENPQLSLHPTQKPVALLEYLIRTYTNAGDTVLDFVMGSGTTGVACVQTGRSFVGIEKDAGYFAIAQRRIAEAQAQPALLE
jgi:DNA modification methylase